MSFLSRAIIIAIASLVGASVGKVGFSDPLPFLIGGGVVAVIAIVIAGLFSHQTAKFEKSVPSKKLLGLRIAMAGLLLALAGWLLAVFVSIRYGYIIAAPGIVIGVIGIVIHFINMLRKSKIA